MKVSFIGLGTMGRPMAHNLVEFCQELIVYDINTSAFHEFEKRGVTATTDLSVAAKGDVICLCLPSSSVVEKLFYSENGLLSYLGEGQTVIDFSTITYSTTLQLAKDLAQKGVEFLDAPVSGMEARAIEGTLSIMCGGEKELFDKMLPLMQCVGNKNIYMGAHGNGQLTKLINQLLFDINVAAIAEILPMAMKMGLDPEKVGEIVNSGTGRSYASEFFIPRILKNIFNEGYLLENAYKDLISAAELGANEGIPLPVLAAATSTYQMALCKGLGREDKGAMIKVFEDLLGVQYRA